MMGDKMGLIVIGGIVAAIGIGIACYFIARAMKGSMKLILSQGSVSSGDKITGSLSVETKKALTCDRMYLALVGEREVRERRRSSSGNNTTQTKWVEFYRDEADVLLDEELQAGFRETYEFELDTPTEASVMTGAQAAARAAEDMPDGLVKAAVSGLSAVAGATSNMMGGRKRWFVKARLETKGVDLAASEKIHVSLKSAV
jgi:hypothetical protein